MVIIQFEKWSSYTQQCKMDLLHTGIALVMRLACSIFFLKSAILFRREAALVCIFEHGSVVNVKILFISCLLFLISDTKSKKLAD